MIFSPILDIRLTKLSSIVFEFFILGTNFLFNFHFFEISFKDLKAPTCRPARKAAPSAVVSSNFGR